MPLFAYGTLKRGQRAHDLLAAATFLGEATTEPRWALVPLGWYPGLVPGTLAVEGELYDVPDSLWPELDRFEGVASGLYERTPVRLRGREEPATTYRYLGDAPPEAGRGVRWPFDLDSVSGK